MNRTPHTALCAAICLLATACGERTDPTGSARREVAMKPVHASVAAIQIVDDRPRLPEEQIDCIASTMYHEANNQPTMGQVAVAEVILRRTLDRRFKPTPCGVVRQRRQFSFVHHGVIPPIPDAKAAERLPRLARMVVAGLIRSPMHDATFYHAVNVKPDWGLKPAGRIAGHIFYIDPIRPRTS